MSKTNLIKASEVKVGNVLVIHEKPHLVRRVDTEGRLLVFLLLQDGTKKKETVPVNSTAWLVVNSGSLTLSQRKKLHGTE